MILAALLFTFPGGSPGELASAIAKASERPVVLMVPEDGAKLRASSFEYEAPAEVKRRVAGFYGLVPDDGPDVALPGRTFPLAVFPGLLRSVELANVREMPRPGLRPPRRGEALPPGLTVAVGEAVAEDANAFMSAQEDARFRGAPGVRNVGALVPETLTVAEGKVTQKTSPKGFVPGTEAAKLGLRVHPVLARVPLSLHLDAAPLAEARRLWATAVGGVIEKDALEPEPASFRDRVLNTWTAAARRMAPGPRAATEVAAAALRAKDRASFAAFFAAPGSADRVTVGPASPAHRVLAAQLARTMPAPMVQRLDPATPISVDYRSDGGVNYRLGVQIRPGRRGSG